MKKPIIKPIVDELKKAHQPRPKPAPLSKPLPVPAESDQDAGSGYNPDHTDPQT